MTSFCMFYACCTTHLLAHVLDALTDGGRDGAAEIGPGTARRQPNVELGVTIKGARATFGLHLEACFTSHLLAHT